MNKKLFFFFMRLKIYLGALSWYLVPITALFLMGAFFDLLLRFSWQGVVLLIALINVYLFFLRLSKWWSDIFGCAWHDLGSPSS